MHAPPDLLSHKARSFAGYIALMWVFFAIGAWYASRIAEVVHLPTHRPAFLFGAVFAVWFVSYFVALAFQLAKKKRETRYV
jgi:hypothetical protein